MRNTDHFSRISAAMEYMVNHLERQPSVQELASHLHMSEFHFMRIFRQWAGVSPKKFLQYITLEELKKNLSTTKNLEALSETVGLSSQSRVYDLFVNIEAVTPGEFRDRGKGVAIEYGYHDSPFGRCLTAITQRGICGLEFIDLEDRHAFERLQQTWPNAVFRQNQESTAETVNLVFSNKGGRINAIVPGTRFQIKVWEALLKVPFGGITSYSDIARNIGQPKASRAVGTAIGSNPIAYLIPCHRVIRSLGLPGGYRWGTGRKLCMLGYERVVAGSGIPAEPLAK